MRNVTAARSHPCWADISLWKAWDWLLGLVPGVPGKEISWKTALAVAVLAGVTPGAGSGAVPAGMLHKAPGPEAGDGINVAPAALVVSSPQGKELALGTPSFHIPAALCWSVQGS